MPYQDLPDHAFWKLCREREDRGLSDLYQPKFPIVPRTLIATAGSCFAQHFGEWVKRSNLRFLNIEPRPALMPEADGKRFGFGIFSARYGNLYTARQLLQLVEDCHRAHLRPSAIWQQDGRWYDGLRPGVEPNGLASRDELELHRQSHLARVRQMFCEADVFVFTLGLTEAWADRKSGTVFPTAPGVVAGTFDPTQHVFLNFQVDQVVDDLTKVSKRLKRLNKNIRILLTVSPVPLTATASGMHVAQATTYSKSVLRVAANELAQKFDHIDYFPSYEIITNPIFGGRFFAENLRSVTQAGVQTVMSAFFGAHDGLEIADAPVPEIPSQELMEDDADDDLICEEVLLEAFAKP